MSIKDQKTIKCAACGATIDQGDKPRPVCGSTDKQVEILVHDTGHGEDKVSELSLKLDLIDNSLDFILDAVTQLSNPAPSLSQIKYSILHLSSGIELLLKQRLLNEHWSLIFANVDRADKILLQKGDFKSVDFGESLNRLERICSIDFGKYKDILESLRKLRNKIEHFQIEINRDEAISILVKAWAFILDFAFRHIDLSDFENAQATFEAIRDKMIAHEHFVDTRLSELQTEFDRLRKEGTVILDCPKCLQDALPITGDDTDCLFCKRAYSVDQAMDEWLAEHEGWHYLDPKERDAEPLIFDCPECGGEGLYHFQDGSMYPPDPGWVCFKCGGQWNWDEISECVRCGRHFYVIDKEEVFCGKCWPED